MTLTSFSFKGWSDEEKEGTFVSWKGEAMSFEMFGSNNNGDDDCVKCKKDDNTWEHKKCDDGLAYACRAEPGRFWELRILNSKCIFSSSISARLQLSHDYPCQ